MFSWLKKHFIPHEGNNHRPHILRSPSTLNIIAIILFIELFAFLLPILSHINTTGNMAAVLPAVLANLTNEERQVQNLPILKVNPILNKAAEMKAQDMASHGYFAHTSPEGLTPWYWLKKVGYQYQYAGENLAINFVDSIDVTNAWMDSPTHKANIIKRNYTEVGTGIARGVYEGRETVFVAQVYASPFPTMSNIIKQNEVKVIPEKIVPEKIVNESDIKEVSVLGAEAPSTNRNTFWQTMFTSPRNTTNIMLYCAFVFILLVLVLYIFIKRTNHHTDLITNGLIVLVIVVAIFLANYYYGEKKMIILDSFDYSN
jgi:hypothetical protein